MFKGGRLEACRDWKKEHTQNKRLRRLPPGRLGASMGASLKHRDSCSTEALSCAALVASRSRRGDWLWSAG